jgi:hypothetical protein
MTGNCPLSEKRRFDMTEQDIIQLIERKVDAANQEVLEVMNAHRPLSDEIIRWGYPLTGIPRHIWEKYQASQQELSRVLDKAIALKGLLDEVQAIIAEELNTQAVALDWNQFDGYTESEEEVRERLKALAPTRELFSCPDCRARVGLTSVIAEHGFPCNHSPTQDTSERYWQVQEG